MSDSIQFDRESKLEGATNNTVTRSSESVAEEIETLPNGDLRIRKRRKRKPRPSLTSTLAVEKGRRRAVAIILGVLLLVGSMIGYVYWTTRNMEKIRTATSWDKKRTEEKLARIEELTRTTVMRTSKIQDLQAGTATPKVINIDEGGTLTVRVLVPQSGSSEWDLLLQGGEKGVREMGRLQTRSGDDNAVVLNLMNLTNGQYELQATIAAIPAFITTHLRSASTQEPRVETRG